MWHLKTGLLALQKIDPDMKKGLAMRRIIARTNIMYKFISKFFQHSNKD